MAKGNGCVTRKVTKQRCDTVEVEPGKHVLRCHKTMQTLRDCVGRPTEVIDSQTEITEQEMPAGFDIQVSMQQTNSSSSSKVTEHEMPAGCDIKISMKQSNSSSRSSNSSFSSSNWGTDVVQEMDDVIEGVGRMTEGIRTEVEGIMSGVERLTEEARRIAGSLFGFPSFPGDEREEKNRPISSFPVEEEESCPISSFPAEEGKREADERDEHEMQDEELNSENADKIKGI